MAAAKQEHEATVADALRTNPASLANLGQLGLVEVLKAPDSFLKVRSRGVRVLQDELLISS